MVALTSLQFTGAPENNTCFAAGESGPATKVKSSVVHGACAEDGERVSQQRFETELSVTTSQKSFVFTIDQTDWTKKKNGVPDRTTAAGRLFAHYGTLKGMPGGALLRCRWEIKDVVLRTATGAAVQLELAKPGRWTENADATFGPFGKKGGRFTSIAPVSVGKTLRVVFPSASAATAFVAEISVGAASSPAATAASPGKRARAASNADAAQASGGGISAGAGTDAADHVAERISAPLMGAAVVFTGEPAMGKVAAGAAVERCGGRVVSSVSKKATFLICSSDGGTYGRGSGFDPASSTKGKKARELGIRLVSEEEFLIMIGEEEAEGSKKPRFG